LKIFLVNPRYRRNTCFRILFINGVTDCLQLTVLAVYAVINLASEEVSHAIQKVTQTIFF
jgi:hypothetical protein